MTNEEPKTEENGQQKVEYGTPEWKQAVRQKFLKVIWHDVKQFGKATFNTGVILAKGGFTLLIACIVIITALFLIWNALGVFWSISVWTGNQLPELALGSTTVYEDPNASIFANPNSPHHDEPIIWNTLAGLLIDIVALITVSAMAIQLHDYYKSRMTCAVKLTANDLQIIIPDQPALPPAKDDCEKVIVPGSVEIVSHNQQEQESDISSTFPETVKGTAQKFTELSNITDYSTTVDTSDYRNIANAIIGYFEIHENVRLNNEAKGRVHTICLKYVSQDYNTIRPEIVGLVYNELMFNPDCKGEKVTKSNYD